MSNLFYIQKAMDDSVESYENPVQRVGKFMEKSKEIYLQQCSVICTRDSTFDPSCIKVYYAESYSQRQLLPLFAHIYDAENKSIKSHLILICGSETTKSTLEQIFERAKRFIDTYMIVGINDLSIQMQEVSSLHFCGRSRFQ